MLRLDVGDKVFTGLVLKPSLLVTGGEGSKERLQIGGKHNGLGRLSAKEHDLANTATGLRE